jgi:hypothetical protein
MRLIMTTAKAAAKNGIGRTTHPPTRIDSSSHLICIPSNIHPTPLLAFSSWTQTSSSFEFAPADVSLFLSFLTFTRTFHYDCHISTTTSIPCSSESRVHILTSFLFPSFLHFALLQVIPLAHFPQNASETRHVPSLPPKKNRSMNTLSATTLYAHIFTMYTTAIQPTNSKESTSTLSFNTH